MNKIQLLDPGRIYVYTISCIHVQYRCGFLQTEIKVLLQSLEDMDIPDPADGTIMTGMLTSLPYSVHARLLHRRTLESEFSGTVTAQCVVQVWLSLSGSRYIGVFYLMCSLQAGESHLTVRINQWTEVSTLIKLNTHDTTEVSVWKLNIYLHAYLW